MLLTGRIGFHTAIHSNIHGVKCTVPGTECDITTSMIKQPPIKTLFRSSWAYLSQHISSLKSFSKPPQSYHKLLNIFCCTLLMLHVVTTDIYAAPIFSNLKL